MHPEKYTKGPNDGRGPVHSQTMKGRPDFLGYLTVQDRWVSKINVPGVNRRDIWREIVINEVLENIQDTERENAPDASEWQGALGYWQFHDQKTEVAWNQRWLCLERLST